MIYVRIELWPGGDRAKAELLQEVQIENRGTGDAVHGDYAARVSHSTRFAPKDKAPFRGFENPARPMAAEVWRRSELIGWRRDRSAVELLHAVLQRLFDPAHGGRTGVRR